MTFVRLSLVVFLIICARIGYTQSINKYTLSAVYTDNDTILTVGGLSQNSFGTFSDQNIGFYPFQFSLVGTQESSWLDIEFYPNPADEFFVVKFEEAELDHANATVYSGIGVECAVDVSYSAGYIEFNFSDLSEGVYYVRISRKNSDFTVIKVVKI